MEAHGAPPNDEPPPHVEPPRVERRGSPLPERIVALLEVLICSDYPTQLALDATARSLGYQPFVQGRLSFGYVALVSLADTALLLALIFLFLWTHGERPRDVLLGARRVPAEGVLGISLAPVALAIGLFVPAVISWLAPSLHTVPVNPLADLLRTPQEAWRFAVVLILAGGVREEVQRAFLLHRFEVWLGGPAVGVIVTSLAFGAGHFLQGADAALATAILGAFWGLVYLRRRSIVAPMVSHASFNLLEIGRVLLVGG